MRKDKFTSQQVKMLLKRESEVWIYSYSDLVTNLMAFFILLMVVRASDEHKANRIRESFATLYGHAPVAGQNTESEFAATVTEMIAKLPQSYQVAVQKSTEGVALTFVGGLFFATGSAEISDQAKQILKSLAPIINKTPKSFRVDVSGHSDSVPMVDSDVYPSNWELSAARAGSVVRYLNEQGVASKRMRAIGYADTQPVSQSLDQNRRVVIKVGRGLVE